MRNIFFLFLAAWCFQACSNSDKDDAWVADSLVITPMGDLTGRGECFEAGDGNWGMRVQPDYSGTFRLEIRTDKPWTLSVGKITTEEAEWLVASAAEGAGGASVDLSVQANSLPAYRKAFVTITTQGAIPVSRKLTIIQKNQGVLQVAWGKKFLFNDNEIVFGPNRRREVVIGTYDSEGDEVAPSVSPIVAWADVTARNGQILLNLSAYDEAGNTASHSATVTLTNLNGGISESIRVTQYASEALTAKSGWSIGAANDKTTCTSGEPFDRIIDDEINTHWQWDWTKSNSSDFPDTPYEFIIDLGASQLFNTFSLWHAQKADNGYVKDVQFKVSDDKTEWIDLGKYRMSESSAEAAAHQGAPYTYVLPGVYKMRYIRLMILSNVGDSKVNNKKNAYLGEFSAYLK